MEQEKEEFEAYKKEQEDEIVRVQKEIQDSYDERREELEHIEDVLRKQKDEVKALYENMIMKMEEDSKLRDEEIRLQTNNMNAKLQELQRRKKNF